MESRYKFGVLGAGAVSASLIGLLPSKTREVGPVSALSYRVASRIANMLRAGYPVRKADELNGVPNVLFHAPPERTAPLLKMFEKAEIDWTGKVLVFCDCVVEQAVRRRFQAKGASTAVVRQVGIQGRLIVEADHGSAALHAVHRIARELRLKPVRIAPGSEDLFDAAVALGGAATTPLIDAVAALLCGTGMRHIEAVRIAALLFERTAHDYAHTGKQSWAWYVRSPSVASLKAQIATVGPHLGPLLRQLLLFGFEALDKHREVGAALPAARHGKGGNPPTPVPVTPGRSVVI
jgi:hypothetical protein